MPNLHPKSSSPTAEVFLDPSFPQTTHWITRQAHQLCLKNISQPRPMLPVFTATESRCGLPAGLPAFTPTLLHFLLPSVVGRRSHSANQSLLHLTPSAASSCSENKANIRDHIKGSGICSPPAHGPHPQFILPFCSAPAQAHPLPRLSGFPVSPIWPPLVIHQLTAAHPPASASPALTNLSYTLHHVAMLT